MNNIRASNMNNIQASIMNANMREYNSIRITGRRNILCTPFEWANQE